MFASFFELAAVWISAHGLALLSAAGILLAGWVGSKLLAAIVKRFAARRLSSHSVGLLIPFVRWWLFLLAALWAAGIVLTNLFGVSDEWFRAAAALLLRTALTFALGCAAIELVLKVLSRILDSSRLEETLHPFILSASRVLLYIALVIGCIDILGISTASMIAAISSVGLALSLSAKDYLSNLIGGIVVLVAKPFSQGDYIELEGYDGVVDEIGLLYTTLLTYDHRQVFIPNNDAAKAKIINHSSAPTRRLDMTFPIGYGADYELACKLIRRAADSTGLALPAPEPVIRMNAYKDRAVEITCRLWVNFDDYYELKFLMNERVKAAFDEAGIPIPYQQMELHIVK